jgi:hypothetical protein
MDSDDKPQDWRDELAAELLPLGAEMPPETNPEDWEQAPGLIPTLCGTPSAPWFARHCNSKLLGAFLRHYLSALDWLANEIADGHDVAERTAEHRWLTEYIRRVIVAELQRREMAG